MSTKSNPGLLITAAVFVLIAGGASWWITLNADPVAVIPMPALPTPNAFDDFVAAGHAIVNPKLVDAAVVETGATAATPAMKQDAVAQNATALARLRIGLKEKYWNPPVRSFTTLLPYFADFRRLARLLKVEGEVKAARGDWNGAVQSDLDGIQLGIALPHGSGLIGMLVGVACESICRRDLWTYAPHLTAAQARSAALRLEALERDRFTYGATMQEEKWTMQASLLQIFHQENFYQTVRELVTTTGGMGVSFDPSYLLYSKRTIFNNITNAMDTDVRTGNLPYYQAIRVKHPPLPSDPLSKTILPTYEQGQFRVAETQTQNSLLMTALALRAYDLEHHAYPDTLSQLAPVYLAHVPDDPFAASGPLRYKRSGASYVLYSIGPDGKDDGGKPIPESATGTSRFVEVSSLGDIVAGVTTR